MSKNSRSCAIFHFLFLSLSVFPPFLCVHLCFRCLLYLYLFFSLSLCRFVCLLTQVLTSVALSVPQACQCLCARSSWSPALCDFAVLCVFPRFHPGLNFVQFFLFFSLFVFSPACFVSVVAWICTLGATAAHIIKARFFVSSSAFGSSPFCKPSKH